MVAVLMYHLCNGTEKKEQSELLEGRLHRYTDEIHNICAGRLDLKVCVNNQDKGLERQLSS